MLILGILISFILGFVVGAALIWLSYQKIHFLMLEIDAKYNRLVTLMSEWQKKL